MTEQLITLIYEKLEKFKDPVSNKSFDRSNNKLNIVCKDGHAHIALIIDPKLENKYSVLSIKLNDALKNIEGLLSANIVFTAEKNLNLEKNEKRKFEINSKNIIAIASGKGGVGKSTFAVNIAVALEKLGHKVGILDADIYGPSIPRMMKINEKPQTNENKKLVPIEKYGIKCMSIGFLIGEDTPTIWRGPMIMKALEQMFNGVEWGELDYLIIDLPPGTGDAQITLAQSSKLSGSIIVSTPQDIALIDARKAINMFRRVDVPVLGIVENMSYFICSNCDERHEIFSHGGAKKEAENFITSYLGELPLVTSLRIHSDEGEPMCISEPESEIAKIYIQIAENFKKFSSV
jgi:ATP-binding protein involved in chromosome partitioning